VRWLAPLALGLLLPLNPIERDLQQLYYSIAGPAVLLDEAALDEVA
jgi:hypothetical protein